MFIVWNSVIALYRTSKIAVTFGEKVRKAVLEFIYWSIQNSIQKPTSRPIRQSMSPWRVNVSESVGGNLENSIWDRLHNVTAYAYVLLDTLSLQEDIVIEGTDFIS